MPRLHVLALAIVLAGSGMPAWAQMDHSKMHMPPATSAPPARKPATRRPVAKKPVAKPTATKKKVADPHAGHGAPSSKASPAPSPQRPTVDHAAMGHDMPMPTPEGQAEPMDHAAMGHDMAMPQEAPGTVDHSGMGHDATATDAEPAVDHAAMGHDMPMPSDEPRQPIPVLTEADRAAAFPEVAGHAAHDELIHSYWLFDRLEGWNADEGTGVGWEALGWMGTDINRVWLRGEGERVDGAIESADVEVLYGRSATRWWVVVAGIRHDFGDGPSQTFAAIGVVGLAPQKFEVEATAYVGQSGQTGARLEAEYDTLLTNRLILQWRAEADLYGKQDERRGLGSGLSTVEAGLRLRYEFTRRFAPYIGVAWERAYGGTADFRRDHGEDTNESRIVAGLRIWF
jgi:copper resistance protein B